MGWLDHQEELEKSSDPGVKKSELTTLEIKLPGGSGFIPVNKNVVKKEYLDEMRPLLIIVDEAAELLQKETGAGADVKEMNAQKADILTSLKSITQLGRAASVHCLIATQRNDTSIISGTIQNNCIFLDTRVVLGEESHK